MLKSDIVILTAFGREMWFLEKIKASGLKCIVLDVTHLLGKVPIEEQHGPFGVLRSEKLNSNGFFDAKWNWSVESVTNGFSLWLKNGVVECNGPLTRHQLRAHDISSENEDYVAIDELGIELNSEKNKSLKLKLQNQPFKKNWFSQFAHNFASPVEVHPEKTLERSYPLPLFSKYYLKKYFSESTADEVINANIQKLTFNKILQWRSLGKALQGFQLDWTRNKESDVGTLESDFFIFMLSRGEFRYLNSELDESFFENKYEEPFWVWTRFNLKTQPHRFIENMPISTVLIDDVFQSWTHENMMIINRKKYDLNVWVKVAYHRKHDKSYLHSLFQIIEAKLKSRIPGLKIESSELPVSVLFEKDEMAPSPFVVYSEKDFQGLSQSKFQNLYLCGTEAYTHLESCGQFERQLQIWNSIVNEIVLKKSKAKKEQLEDSL